MLTPRLLYITSLDRENGESVLTLTTLLIFGTFGKHQSLYDALFLLLKLGERASFDLPKIQETITEKSRITTRELGKSTYKSLHTIELHIKSLRDQRFIEQVGADKTGHWTI